MRETRCDVLVIGAGPAGIAAAVRAAEDGGRVALYDMQAQPGGQIWRGETQARRNPRAMQWLDALARSGATFFGGRRLIAADAHAHVALFDDGDDGERVHYAKAIVATGARELVLPCPGWTLPGVFGAGGLQVLVKGGWPIAQRRVVVAGSGPLLLAVAATLRAAGAELLCIAEQARWASLRAFVPAVLRGGKLAQAFTLARALRGVPYRAGCWISEVHGDSSGVSAVTLRDGRREWRVDCDAVALGHGLVPNLDVAQAFGCATSDGAVVVDQDLRTSAADVFCAGEGTGIGGIDQALAQGELAGLRSRGASTASDLQRRVHSTRRFGIALGRHFALRDELRGLARPDTIICRCEDVTYAAISACNSPRAARLHTRCGMGHCQGRTCGAIATALFGWPAPTSRIPLAPTRIACLANPSSSTPDESIPT